LLSALMLDPKAHYPTSNLPLTVVDESKLKDITAYYQARKSFLEPRLKALRDRLVEFLGN